MNHPSDLKYTAEHVWVKAEGNTAKLGITDYAQDQLGDILYVDLPDVDREFAAGDIFTEVYGFKKARLVIWMGFAMSFFAVLIYLIVIGLPHPGFWEGQSSYETVMGTTPRVAIASFAGYLFGEFSNSIILSKLKVATKGKNLWMRTILSTVVGEGFDSVIFITISFWGTMENSVVLKMIMYQYLFKVAYEVLFTPLTYVIVKWVKKKEGVDTFDYNVKYNPIKG